jgi:hypothetical protein
MTRGMPRPCLGPLATLHVTTHESGLFGAVGLPSVSPSRGVASMDVDHVVFQERDLANAAVTCRRRIRVTSRPDLAPCIAASKKRSDVARTEKPKAS